MRKEKINYSDQGKKNRKLKGVKQHLQDKPQVPFKYMEILFYISGK